MTRWEYCIVTVEIYREGSGVTRELLSITRPGEHRAAITNPLGLAGLVNELGADGWELVDVESGNFYLKRPVRRHFSAKALTSAGTTTAAGSLEQFSGEKRVNYFEGKLLSADDFTADVTEHRPSLRLRRE